MKMRHIVISALPIVIGFILLWVGLAWLIWRPLLVEHLPELAGSIEQGALLFGGAGVTLLLSALGVGRLSLLVNALVLSVNAWIAVSQTPPIDWNFWSQQSPLTPLMQITIVLVCCALGLMELSPRFKRLRWTLGGIACIAAGLQVVARVQSWPAGNPLAMIFRIEGLYTLLLLLMAMSTMARITQRRPEKVMARQTGSVWLAAAGSLVAVLCWCVIGTQELSVRVNQAKILLGQVDGQVNAAVRIRFTVLNRLAARWASEGKIPDAESFAFDARAFLRDIPGFKGMALVDDQGAVLMSHSANVETDESMKQYLSTSTARILLDHIEETGKAHIGKPLPSVGPPYWALVATRLPKHNGKPTYLVAVQQLADLFASIPGPSVGLAAVSVELRGIEIYSVGTVNRGDLLVKSPVEIDHENLTTVKGWYRGTATEGPISFLSTSALLVGIVSTLFLIVNQQLSWSSRRRSYKLEMAHEALQRSLDAQHRLNGMKARIMRLSGDIIFSLNRDLVFIEVSVSVERILGYTPNELKGRRVIEFVRRSDQRRTGLALESAMENSSDDWKFQNQLNGKFGLPVEMKWSAEWVESEQLLYCVARDVDWIRQQDEFNTASRRVYDQIIARASLDTVLRSIAGLARATVPSATFAVRRLSEDEGSLELLMAEGPGADFERSLGDKLPLTADSPQCDAVRDGEAVFVGKVDCSDCASICGTASFAYWASPMSVGPKLLGAVGVYSSDDQRMSYDTKALAAIGQLAAVAIKAADDRRNLEVSEQRYRSLYHFNPDAVYSFDLTGRYTSVNPQAGILTGLSERELLKLTFRSVVVSDDLEMVTKHFAAVLNGEVRRYLARCSVANGQVRTFDVTNMPIQVEDQVVGVFGIARDVTEQERTGAVIRAKEKQLRQLLIDMRDAVLVVNQGGYVRFANEAAQQMFGRSQVGLQNMHVPLPEHPPKLFEWQTVGREGNTLDVEVALSETEWENQPMRLLSLRDLRPRKHFEQQLHLLHRSLEACYNAVTIADATDPEFPLIYVNPAFERMTGFSRTEALGRNCRFLQGPETDPAAVAKIRAALSDNREIDIVLQNTRKDGTAFWNHLFVAPVPNELGRVENFIGILNDITQQKKIEEQLEYGATHDILTELPNRRLLREYLTKSSADARRRGDTLAVGFFDLDGFKLINDSMGHDFGDRVLIQVAQRMRACLQKGEMVARVGGDEFVIVLPSATRERSHRLIEAAISAVGAPYRFGELEIHITASAGLTVSDGSIKDPMQLVRESDLAMFRAKREGRNTWHEYTIDLGKDIEERLALRGDLKRALDNGELALYYQPIVDGRTHRVAGVEALLRWQHPTRGFVSPSFFIPLAEETGQIIPLSRWVLEKACRDAAALQDLGWADCPVALNVSALYFQRTDFVSELENELRRWSLKPQSIEIEITESVLLDDAERAIDTLRHIRDLGVKISIDDFGTGYSSLNYLKNLPIDKVKIDRSFVQEVISDRHDASIAKAIISMAHHLDLKVVAEGVEIEAQYAFLRRNHCDYFQGYLFAHPMPYEALTRYLRDDSKGSKTWEESGAAEVERVLMLLDDEENILRALVRVLRRDGYRILTAQSPQEAFRLLASNKVDVIVSDQRMPEMTGTEFFHQVKDMYPETVRIILSGYTDLASVTSAINKGAIYRYFTKPWDDEELRDSIAIAFRKRESDGAAAEQY
ncbi:EAL domain-containing protein [Achromobacter sp. SLBN-14]|uniref:EAL domain-containing protein n=1 Tax=Achromobacter sp. SLBN-14 TaxID=2768442 RepID=UPI0011536286|nr:EAL domain-containing protein [Achromobacter sp. SLBN-14]TQJ94692.1 PAS domain S-box-containing protein/diguanylate cyclase (GGDEF)-like protein [Achromobacter sp. SLBN-14]